MPWPLRHTCWALSACRCRWRPVHMTESGRVCNRCVYDSTLPGIRFNAEGICNYCEIHDQMVRQYPVGDEGERILRGITDRIRDAGKGKKFDCVVGVSGGCDSS